METGIHAIHAIKGADQLRINQHLAWKPALFFNSKTQIFACRQHLGSDMDPLFFFFDSEVIFHVLFPLGHEESTIFNQIRNQSTPFQKIFSLLNQIIFLWFHI